MDSSFLAHSSHFFWALSFNAIRPHSTHFKVITTPPRTRQGNEPARGNRPITACRKGKRNTEIGLEIRRDTRGQAGFTLFIYNIHPRHGKARSWTVLRESIRKTARLASYGTNIRMIRDSIRSVVSSRTLAPSFLKYLFVHFQDNDLFPI
jgi:hypothetical protein